MPATSEKVVLRVDPATARAYREASEEEKKRARSAFESALAERREEARQTAAEELIRYMDELGREAEARGLTPEILDDILHDRPPSPEELAGPHGDPHRDPMEPPMRPDEP